MLVFLLPVYFFYFRRVRSFFGAEGGGGVHFKLERTSCQHSLKYISLYNKEGAPFSSEKIHIFCVINIRSIILSVIHLVITSSEEAIQS